MQGSSKVQRAEVWEQGRAVVAVVVERRGKGANDENEWSVSMSVYLPRLLRSDSLSQCVTCLRCCARRYKLSNEDHHYVVEPRA